MVTSLLTEKGVQGARVVGATGFNNRTGEFMVFKSKATVLSTAGNNSLWLLNTELAGYNTFRSRTMTGDGVAMAWRAGAELTLMEQTAPHWARHRAQAYLVRRRRRCQFREYPAGGRQRQKLPWPSGMAGRRRMGPSPGNGKDHRKGIQDGTYALPFFGDFPGYVRCRTPGYLESDAGRGIHYQESSPVPMKAPALTRAKHLLMNYKLYRRHHPSHWRRRRRRRPRRRLGPEINPRRSVRRRGTDVCSRRPQLRCLTGRYAGRKAAAYARQIGRLRSLQRPDRSGKSPRLCPD